MTTNSRWDAGIRAGDHLKIPAGTKVRFRLLPRWKPLPKGDIANTRRKALRRLKKAKAKAGDPLPVFPPHWVHVAKTRHPCKPVCPLCPQTGTGL